MGWENRTEIGGGRGVGNCTSLYIGGVSALRVDFGTVGVLGLLDMRKGLSSPLRGLGGGERNPFRFCTWGGCWGLALVSPIVSLRFCHLDGMENRTEIGGGAGFRSGYSYSVYIRGVWALKVYFGAAAGALGLLDMRKGISFLLPRGLGEGGEESCFVFCI